MNRRPSQSWTDRAPFGALALDLDGTLLSPRNRLERGTLSLLREAARVIPVHIITGRMEAAARSFWRELELDTPLVSCNGANIAVPGRTPLFRAGLPRPAVRKLHEIAGRHDWHVNFYVDDELRVLRDGSRIQWYAEHFGVPFSVVDEKAMLDGPEPLKILLIVQPDERNAIRDRIAAEFTPDEAHITTSGEAFVEVMPPACDKGTALARLAGLVDIPLDRWVAVGDGPNDHEMLQTAGLGVAVSSGSPELARSAGWVVPPLWLSGLADLLYAAFHFGSSGRAATYGEALGAFWNWLPGADRDDEGNSIKS